MSAKKYFLVGKFDLWSISIQKEIHKKEIRYCMYEKVLRKSFSSTDVLENAELVLFWICIIYNIF
jgi:hypothetical protein